MWSDSLVLVTLLEAVSTDGAAIPPCPPVCAVLGLVNVDDLQILELAGIGR